MASVVVLWSNSGKRDWISIVAEIGTLEYEDNGQEEVLHRFLSGCLSSPSSLDSSMITFLF